MPDSQAQINPFVPDGCATQPWRSKFLGVVKGYCWLASTTGTHSCVLKRGVWV